MSEHQTCLLAAAGCCVKCFNPDTIIRVSVSEIELFLLFWTPAFADCFFILSLLRFCCVRHEEKASQLSNRGEINAWITVSTFLTDKNDQIFDIFLVGLKHYWTTE